MNTRNDVEVIINNKRYTLSGYESGEYLQKIASYINSKYTEFKQKDSYNKLEPDMRNFLMQINIADDYFKAIKQVDELHEDADIKGNEIFDMKHEVISVQTKLEALQKEHSKLQAEYNEAQRKMIKLETELEDMKRAK